MAERSQTAAAPRRSRYALRALALGYVAILVALPVAVVLWRAFDEGVGQFCAAISSEQAVQAFRLTGLVAGVAVVINVLFGVGVALLLTRYRFAGKRLLNVVIDLPISVSPIVVGLALVLVYGPRNGWLGRPLADSGIEVIYAVPGMILATVFVSLPLVLREIVPVLQDEGMDAEHAARVLGASAVQRFVRITLPTIRWALAYGIVLSLARSIGEFGAVQVVSGNVSGAGQTQTATLLVNERVQQLVPGAYQVSVVLIAVAVVAIVAVSLLRPKELP
ncbi:sulfate ABC transporter permease subunit [Jatrophihabitans cynanchi]|jgi:sulfate transport system permease protein|uniref:Sulfate ABC transporter permease subunit n=1 Tax=Jatrophihabitans cynanchi TaxID=2944128 RepID=A0ABY7K2F4_9ACTN|nr:sulfate ABC transporter permease subunit [Jatrophihabitans sp. SB3-54]WAX57496.1 sulfate ABC transporter permease subunit [Jatrophihabitans sp. SB3-54]